MYILDELFELLCEERRRYALYYLEEHDGPVSVSELAEQVAEWETSPPNGVSDEKYRDVHVELLHKDLPKAAESEYIQYNRDSKEIELVEEPPAVGTIISVARLVERPDRYP